MAELITMDTTQMVEGTIPAFPSLDGFIDSAGAAARIGSVPVWSSADSTVATVTVDPDGMSNIRVISGDAPGTTQVKMSVDVDLSEPGVVPIEFFYDVAITAVAVPPVPPAASLGKALFAAPVPKA